MQIFKNDFSVLTSVIYTISGPSASFLWQGNHGIALGAFRLSGGHTLYVVFTTLRRSLANRVVGGALSLTPSHCVDLMCLVGAGLRRAVSV